MWIANKILLIIYFIKFQWPSQESPATAARAFLAQAYDSQSPSPLSDTSLGLPQVQSTPVLRPYESPDSFACVIS